MTAASTTWSMLELGDLLHTLGRLPEAERMLSDAIPILRTQPATVPLARALTDFGNVLRDRGRLDAAEASYRESLALFRKVLPARTAQLPLTEIYLSRLLIMRGGPSDLAAADSMLTTNLATLRGMFEDEHPLTALALKELGYLRTEQGRYAEADARLKEAQVVIARWLGANHPQVPRARVHQAELARRQGRAAEAIALAERALAEFAALGLTDHPAAIDARLVLRRGAALRAAHAGSPLDPQRRPDRAPNASSCRVTHAPPASDPPFHAPLTARLTRRLRVDASKIFSQPACRVFRRALRLASREGLPRLSTGAASLRYFDDHASRRTDSFATRGHRGRVPDRRGGRRPRGDESTSDRHSRDRHPGRRDAVSVADRRQLARRPESSRARSR